MKPRPAWVWWVLCLLLVLAAGWYDRDTLFLEQARYCQMVSEGAWPDYERSFARECTADGKVRGKDDDRATSVK